MLSTHIFPSLQASVFGHVQQYRNAIVLVLLSAIPAVLLHVSCFHIYHKALVNRIHAVANDNKQQTGLDNGAKQADTDFKQADADFKQTTLDKAVLSALVWVPVGVWLVFLFSYQVPVLKVANRFIDYIIVPGLDLNE